MLVFVFLLVLLAIAGLLGAFLKAIALLVLAGMLGLTALAVGGYLVLRHAMRTAERDLDRRSTQVRMGRAYRTREDPMHLPSERDDRY
jgi:UPF0716 family protein affecting phage T7 exclusion